MQIKVFDEIAKASLGTKLGAVVAVLILIAVGFYFVFYQGVSDELSRLESAHVRLQQDLVGFKDKHANYIRDIEELNRRRARQKEQLRILPPTTEMSSFLNDINKLGDLCGLILVRVVPKAEEGHGFYSSIPVDLDIQGTYHQITKFFYGVGQLERIINLENISLGGPRAVEGDVILNVNVKATTFRSLEGKKI